MKICVLGFGSLLEHQYSNNTCAELKVSTPFAPTDFSLPIRLSFITGKGTKNEKLALVIDPEASSKEPVYYAVHKYSSLPAAIRNLRERENTKLKNIGYLNVNNDNYRCSCQGILSEIRKFCQKNYFDVAIWTDTPPNFNFKQGSRDHPNIQIQKYLKSHPRVLRNTQEYLRLLPSIIVRKNPLLTRICRNNIIPKGIKKCDQKFI